MDYSNLHINLVAFNVPYPADYGGVIDVFYKIKSLAKLGIKIHLHCFSYGRKHHTELDKYCATTTIYERKTGLLNAMHKMPYIVKSRKIKLLRKNLLSNNYPILFEGLHCCAFLDDPALKTRNKIVRMHNVEWNYYAHLATLENNFFKRKYFQLESIRLKKFEQVLTHSNAIIAISEEDKQYLSNLYSNVYLVSAFHPNEEIHLLEGKGKYILYHGDLSVKDNEQAVCLIVDQLAKSQKMPFIIAGKAPSPFLKNHIKKYSWVELVDHPSDKVLFSLIQKAHINLLWSFQSAGMKLKLINALYHGRHCLVNPKMISSQFLNQICHISETIDDLNMHIIRLKDKDFVQEEIQKRKICLEQNLSNLPQAQKIAPLFMT